MGTIGPKSEYYRKAAASVIKALKARGFEGYYAADRDEARELALSLIPEGSSVGWGGSMTLNETGVIDALKNGNYEVISRESAATPEERKKVFSRIAVCDCFLMSTNAITQDGQLVNVDGTANRVAFLCFGPASVIVVTGMNKLVTSVAEGENRARNVAAPPNAMRLGRNTPCAVTGKCADCQSEDCICCQTVITRRSPKGRIKVILVGEELGL